MKITRSLMRSALLRRFAADSRAIAATELALIVPVMLIVYLGSIEVEQLISIDRKTTFATRTVADIVSRLSDCKTSIMPSGMSDVLKAADAVVAPYDPTPLSMVVSCVSVDKNGKATLMWSTSLRGTARTSTDKLVPPTGLGDTSSTTYWVLSESNYAYQPIASYVLKGTYNLGEQLYMNSRL